MITADKQLEFCLSSSIKLQEFLVSNNSNIHQVCSAQFEPKLRKLTFQALKKQDARAICVVLQAIGYLAKQNLSQGIHVLLETGLLNILEKVLVFSDEALKDDAKTLDAQNILKLFFDCCLSVIPLQKDHSSWFKLQILTLLKIILRSYLQLDISYMAVESIIQILQSLSRDETFAIRSVVCNSCETMNICKVLIQRLHEVGDLPSQSNIIEMIVRLTPSKIRMDLASEWNANENLTNLFKSISYRYFDQTVRMYLNAVNANQDHLKSISVDHVVLGNNVYTDHCWLDLSLRSVKVVVSFADPEDDGTMISESLDRSSIKHFNMNDKGCSIELVLDTLTSLVSIFGEEIVSDDTYVIKMRINKNQSDSKTLASFLSAILSDHQGKPNQSSNKVSTEDQEDFAMRPSSTSLSTAVASHQDLSQDFVPSSMGRKYKASKEISLARLQVENERIANQCKRQSDSHNIQTKHKISTKCSQPHKKLTATKRNNSLHRSSTACSSSSISSHRDLSQNLVPSSLEISFKESKGISPVRLAVESSRYSRQSGRRLELQKVQVNANLSQSEACSTKDESLAKISRPVHAYSSCDQSFCREIVPETQCTEGGQDHSNSLHLSQLGPDLPGHSKSSPVVAITTDRDTSSETNTRSTIVVDQSSHRDDSSDVPNPAPRSKKKMKSRVTKGEQKVSKSSSSREEVKVQKPTRASMNKEASVVSTKTKTPPARRASNRKIGLSSEKTSPNQLVVVTTVSSKRRRSSRLLRNNNVTLTSSDVAPANESLAERNKTQVKNISPEKTSVMKLPVEKNSTQINEVKGNVRSSKNQPPSDEKEVETSEKTVEESFPMKSAKSKSARARSKSQATKRSCETPIDQSNRESKKRSRLKRNLTAEDVAAQIVSGDSDKDEYVSRRSPFPHQLRSKKGVFENKKEDKNVMVHDDDNCAQSVEMFHDESVKTEPKKKSEVITSTKKLRFSVDPYEFEEKEGLSKDHSSNQNDKKKSTVRMRKSRTRKEKRALFESSYSAVSTASDLSWVRSHKKKANSKNNDLTTKKPLRKFEPKRKQFSRVETKLEDHESPFKAVLSSPETARDVSQPSPLMPKATLSDFEEICRDITSCVQETSDANINSSLIVETSTAKFPACFNQSDVSCNITLPSLSPATTQCSHISTIKTPHAIRFNATADSNKLSPILSPKLSVPSETSPFVDHTETNNGIWSNLKDFGQNELLKKSTSFIQKQNNKTPSGSSTVSHAPKSIYKIKITPPSTTSKTSKKLDFNSNKNKSSRKKSRTGKMSITSSIPVRSSSHEDSFSPEANRKRKGPLSHIMCSIERNMDEVKMAWKRFTNNRNSKLSDFERTFHRIATQHNQFMQRLSEIERSSVEKIKKQNTEFESLITQAINLTSNMDHANKVLRSEQQDNEDKFAMMMSDLSRQVTKDLNKLMKAH